MRNAFLKALSTSSLHCISSRRTPNSTSTEFQQNFMPVLNAASVTPYLPNFLRKNFQRNSACFIFRLPFDVHLNAIFPYLCVEDIISLRRVNKAFFLLTHEPVIWKRFLPYVRSPIPPLRPTFRYTLQSTDYEIEQLVTRAISLQDNWCSSQPVITSSAVLTTHYRVLEMKLLPGGKYLVASVKDAYSYRFFIIIYHLDHPKGYQALARAPTHTKAFDLQAKYCEFDGEQGIMIAYVRRMFQSGGPINVDPSDYSSTAEIDPVHPMTGELICFHVKLKSLETLADPEIRPGSIRYKNLASSEPPPFSEVVTLASHVAMKDVSIFELDGLPHISVVQQPDRIVVIDLTKKTISTLLCHDHEDFQGLPHSIKATRVLPGQHNMLVVRCIQVVPKDEEEATQITLVELFNLPDIPDRLIRAYPTDRYVRTDYCSAVHISDYGIPNSNLPLPPGPPPPISIFFQTLQPVGVIHHVLWPDFITVPATSTHPAYPKYYYPLQYVCFQTQHISSPLVTHVLPGARRALMYTVMPGDRKDSPAMVSLRRYVNPEYQHETYPIPREDCTAHILRKRWPLVPPKIYASFPLDPDSQQLYQDGGLAAIAWDEGIGRVCLASVHGEQIQILDFAHMVHPDARFARWQRNQNIAMQCC